MAGQHYREEGNNRSEEDAYLKSLGIKVLRYSDKNV